MSDQMVPEDIPYAESKPEFRVVDNKQLVDLIDQTLEETVIQQASVAFGFSKLISGGISEKSNNISPHAERIERAVGKIVDQCRALEKAIDMGRNGQPIPIKRYPDKECIDLDEVIKIINEDIT